MKVKTRIVRKRELKIPKGKMYSEWFVCTANPEHMIQKLVLGNYATCPICGATMVRK